MKTIDVAFGQWVCAAPICTDDIQGGPALVTANRGQLQQECMMPDSGVDYSGQSLVRSLHPGGANCAMADASVRFISDFVESGSSLGDGLIDDNPKGEFDANVFRTWQRLNVSRDGYAIEGEY